jgi:hypothetical protein
MKASTQAELSHLQTAIQNYFQDWSAYPGPIPESQIYGNQSGPAIVTTLSTPIPGVGGSPPSINAITSSENLFLALSGGLDFSTTSPVTIQYDVSHFNKGPVNLNVLNPRQYGSYFDAKPAEIANDGVGDYMSWTASNPHPGIPGIAQGPFPGTPGTPTFIVPEYLDHFSDPRPIIYLRAITGAKGIADNYKARQQTSSDYTPIRTSAPTQYYSTEMSPYWIGPGSTTPFAPQVGAPLFYYTIPAAAGKQAPKSSSYTYLYTDAYTFFQSPSQQDSPKNKDSYILISAGYDGAYGTDDDVMYPPL